MWRLKVVLMEDEETLGHESVSPSDLYTLITRPFTPADTCESNSSINRGGKAALTAWLCTPEEEALHSSTCTCCCLSGSVLSITRSSLKAQTGCSDSDAVAETAGKQADDG